MRLGIIFRPNLLKDRLVSVSIFLPLHISPVFLRVSLLLDPLPLPHRNIHRNIHIHIFTFLRFYLPCIHRALHIHFFESRFYILTQFLFHFIVLFRLYGELVTLVDRIRGGVDQAPPHLSPSLFPHSIHLSSYLRPREQLIPRALSFTIQLLFLLIFLVRLEARKGFYLLCRKADWMS